MICLYCQKIIIENLVFKNIKINFFTEIANFLIISMDEESSSGEKSVYISNILVENLKINGNLLNKYDSFLFIHSNNLFSKFIINKLIIKSNYISMSNSYLD